MEFGDGSVSVVFVYIGRNGFYAGEIVCRGINIVLKCRLCASMNIFWAIWSKPECFRCKVSVLVSAASGFPYGEFKLIRAVIDAVLFFYI